MKISKKKNRNNVDNMKGEEMVMKKGSNERKKKRKWHEISWKKENEKAMKKYQRNGVIEIMKIKYQQW